MPAAPYTFIDPKGGKWLVEYTAPTITVLRPWHAKSTDYPLEPLSGNEDDVPIRIALTESGLIDDIVQFANRHTKIVPKPYGPPVAPGYVVPHMLGEADEFASGEFASPAARDAAIRELEPIVRVRGSAIGSASGAPLTDAGVEIVLAIGLFESRFGQVPSWSYWTTQDGKTMLLPSYNFGGILPTPGAPSFVKYVPNEKGVNEKRSFASFATPSAGVRAFFASWGKPETIAAANTGDAAGVAKAMGVLPEYAHAIATNAQIVAQALGKPLLIRIPAKSSSSLGIFTITAAAIGAALLLKSRG